MDRIFSNDPILRNEPGLYDYSREEWMERAFQRVRRLYEIDHKRFFDERKPYFIDQDAHFQGLPPNLINYSMFLFTVENLGTDEQREKWIPMIKKQQINGCYAQTELGHGSNIRGLETTATLDKETDEWIIHSPTLTATKMWPGDMGLVSNHAIVFAQVVIDGKNKGVCPFFMQTRELESHKLIKGVEGGDLGMKISYEAKDNGWMRFDKVRVPRDAMLMRYTHVSKEGKMTIRGDTRVTYSIMMQIRATIILGSGYIMARALTIAIRYSSVRRQFSTVKQSNIERPIIEYQTQQAKLIPALAYTFGFSLVGRRVLDKTWEMVTKLE